MSMHQGFVLWYIMFLCAADPPIYLDLANVSMFLMIRQDIEYLIRITWCGVKAFWELSEPDKNFLKYFRILRYRPTWKNECNGNSWFLCLVCANIVTSSWKRPLIEHMLTKFKYATARFSVSWQPSARQSIWICNGLPGCLYLIRFNWILLYFTHT